MTVNGVTADGAQAVQTNMKTGSFSVTDSAANVSARLDALNAAGKISSITLSDTNPLRITAAQLTNNSFALGRLPASWKAVVTQAAVAAAGTLQSNTHVPLFSIRDSAANIVAGLDTLNAAGKLSEIALTGTEPLVMTAARYATATGVLLKITGSWSVSLTAAGASSVMDSHVVSYSITDTASNVLAALTALNSVSRLTAINLSDAVTLPLTMTQFTNGSAALGKLAAKVSLTISGVTAAAAASMQANSRITTFTVLDTAASIAAGLEKLNTLGKIAGIAIRDGVPLTITAAQFNANAAALGKLPLSAAISVSAAAASAVTGLQANARIASFSVSDTAANIAANIAALNAASRLQLITLTDSAPLSVTYGQLANAAAVLAKLPLDYGLTISGVAAQSAASVQITAHVRSFTVNDTVSNVTVYLDQLTTCGKLTTINLTDSKPLALIYAQYSNDTTAMSKITGTWSATVSGVAASAAARVQADSHVSTFTVNDTAASVSASFDGLNGISKLTSITLSNTASLTMTSAQLANNTIALSKLAPGYHLTIQNAKVSDLPSIHANSHVTAIQLIDTAANIIGGLATLNADQLITSVTLTGGNALALTYAQFAAGGTALGKLAATNVVTVSGVSAANAQQVQGNARVTSFTVTDSAAGIAANIESLAGDGKLTAITMTGAASLTLTYPGFLLGTAALNRLTGTWSASLTDVNAAAAATIAADAHVSRFTVSDTLANIGNRLDQLEAAAKAGKLTSINVTDSGGSLTLSPEQYAAGADAIALMHGGFTINHAVAASNAKINLIWAASTQAAPAAFRTAVTYAAEYFQTLITNPITINLAVGYGEVGGSALPGHALGAAGPDNGLGLTYGQFRTYLGTQAYSQTSQNIVANLPVYDPSNGSTVYLAAAQAKAMGLMASSNTAVDGSMGFATDPDGSLFAYDPANRAVAGKYDFIGVVEHEISHALGRIAFGGGYGSWISTLDLFRFTAPGVNSPNAISGAYFSIDNGTTNLNPFAASSDLGDWAAGAGMDANVAYSRPGVINQFSATDIVEMNALGFATSGTPSASFTNVAPGGAAGGLNAPSLTLTGSPTLAFMTDDVPILHVSLHPAQGIEQVALFSFGAHLLKIDLDGVDPSAFLAFDTSISGHHAIALADRNDPTHGIVLMDMPANNTAADLMAHHLTFRDGMAIVG